MGSLPDEAILEILSRMPPKNAMQMSCVCKTWQNLLNSPYFRCLHLRNFTRKEGNHRLYKFSHDLTHFGSRYCLHLYDEGQPNQNSTLMVHCEYNFPVRFTIVGIVNGIVCLAYHLLFGIVSAFLWNPIIERKVTILGRQEFMNWWSFNLRGNVSLGFAYDSATNDYKLFCIESERQQDHATVAGPTRFDVHSMNHGETTVLNRLNGFNFMVANRTHGVFFNYSCHWVVISQMKRDNGKKCCVLSVSASDYSLETHDLPEVISPEIAVLCNVAAIHGYLGLIPHLHSLKVCYNDVWIMKEYGNAASWTIKYRISIEEAPEMAPILVWKSGHIMNHSLTKLHEPHHRNIEVVKLAHGGTYIHKFKDSFVFLREGKPCKCLCSL